MELHHVLVQEPAHQLQKGLDPQQPACFQEPAENSSIRYVLTAHRHAVLPDYFTNSTQQHYDADRTLQDILMYSEEMRTVLFVETPR